MTNHNWHQLAVAKSLSSQQSDSEGLTADEATHRFAAHGPNRLTPPKKRWPQVRFLHQY